MTIPRDPAAATDSRQRYGKSPSVWIRRSSDISLAHRPHPRDIIALRTIVLSHPAAKQLDALPSDAREAIEEALALYAILGLGDVKRLQGRNGYRLRIGRYRVLFDQDATTILAVYVGKRETTTYRQ